MRSAAISAVLTGILLAAPVAGLASPPARPLALTPDQFEAIRQLETQSPHAAVCDVQATYTSQREAQLAANLVANDIATAGLQGAYVFVPLILLIAAAPL